MNAFRRWRQAILAALLFALTLTAWAIFAPQQIGGNAAYVIIIGNSMEPTFRRGDLVIVRRAPFYQVGEAVAYRNPDLQRYVFHRIIERQGNHFLLQGDNNDWVDSYRPQVGEIVGRQWIHLPGFGRVVQGLRQPWAFGVLAGLTAGALAAVFLLARSARQRRVSTNEFGNRFVMEKLLAFVQKFRRRTQCVFRRRRWRTLPAQEKTPADLRGLGTWLETLFFVFGLLAFLSLALGMFAFTRPLTRLASDDIEYQHNGVFAYTAAAPYGVYDAPQVTPGQPIFHKLTCLLTMNFDYALLGADVQNAGGTYRLTARVREERSGWERSILIQPATPFEGRTYSAEHLINVCSAVSLVETLQEKTEYRSTYYTLIIEPAITLRGTLDSRVLEDTFTPRLAFYFDSTLFYLIREDKEKNPLVVSQKGVSHGWKPEPNTMMLLGKAFSILSLRWVAATGLFVSLLALSALALFVAGLARRSQSELAQVKYGTLLIEVQSKAELPAAPLVEVASIDDLARLAERHGTSILYQPSRPLHYYYVPGAGIVYRYAVNEGSAGILTASIAQLESGLRRALEQQEFQVYYQPIVSLPERKIVGVEALLRWQHPHHGLVAPAEFLAAAEATGLIEPIGEWLLQTAGAQCRAWQEAGLTLWLAVNLSLRELSPRLTRNVRRLLQRSGLDANRLRVEVAESGILGQLEEILPCLQELGGSGVHIVLDDFTGHASILTLERLQVHSIKLDRPLVEQICTPQGSEVVRRSILAARGWGVEVTAEGVEDEQQLDFLLSTSCTLAQGYLFGRPMPAEQVTLVLTGENPPPVSPPESKEQERERRQP